MMPLANQNTDFILPAPGEGLQTRGTMRSIAVRGVIVTAALIFAFATTWLLPIWLLTTVAR